MKGLWAKPDYRTRCTASVREAQAVYLATPEGRETRRRAGKRLADSRAGVKALAASPESRRRGDIKRSETVLGWCPPPYRDLYRSMVRKLGHAATARRAIEDQIAVECKRMLGGKLPDMKAFARAKAALKWEKERT